MEYECRGMTGAKTILLTNKKELSAIYIKLGNLY